MSASQLLAPTRRLPAKERRVFDEVLSNFVHFGPSDAETLTQYAEAVIRYEKAAKEAKRNPTLTLPTFNKATGNQTGTRVVRNPALTTIKEAQTQMATLARRLMIDPSSAEKRARLLTKRSRALLASEQAQAANKDISRKFSEAEVEAMMRQLQDQNTVVHRAENLRDVAIFHLELIECGKDPDCADILLGRN